MSDVTRDRLFTRKELRASLGLDGEFLKQLADFYGLVPLGRGKTIYWGDNLIDALFRHARNESVPSERKALATGALRRRRRPA